MTPPTPQTELDKAIELADKFARKIDRPLHQFSESTQDELVELAEQALSSAAKRVKELEKENAELKEQIVPGFFGRLAAKKSNECQLLRAEYKKALEALDKCKYLMIEINHQIEQFQKLSGQIKRLSPLGDSILQVSLELCCDSDTNKALSTPSAIAAMKGEQ